MVNMALSRYSRSSSLSQSAQVISREVGREGRDGGMGSNTSHFLPRQHRSMRKEGHHKIVTLLVVGVATEDEGLRTFPMPNL